MKKLYFNSFLVFFILTTTLNAQQWNGLTYYSNSGSTIGRLIDTNSAVVKTFTFTGGTGYSTHLMPGGYVYRTVSNSGNVLTGGGMTGRIQKWDYNNNLLWDYTYSSSTYCLHHDHCPLPNGNVLVISYDVKTATEVSNAGGNFAGTMWAEKIMELKPVGTNSAQVVWEWKVWDHLVQNVNAAKANYQASIVNNPQLLNINFQAQKDWMHMNGIDYNPVLDQIVVSSHNLNEWYIIDHSTTTAEAASHTGGLSGKGGDFLYRWGNPAAYGATGSTILNVTHDAHWIPEGCPDAGFLAGINNKGQTSPSTKTTVDRIPTPRVNYNYTIAPGSAFTPASYSARHTSSGYTSNMGCSNQFPNGNQMVCLAMVGSIYEIDPAGNVIWTFSTSGATPQAHRYTTCYLNNPAPVQPSVSLISGALVSTPASSYQWYMNGNLIAGATSQSYTPSQYGVYVVKTTDANGCVFAHSTSFVYSATTAIKASNAELSTLNVYPNPGSGLFTLELAGLSDKAFTVSVYDVNGKLLLKEKNATTINLGSYDTGIYLIHVESGMSQGIYKKVSLIK